MGKLSASRSSSATLEAGRATLSVATRMTTRRQPCVYASSWASTPRLHLWFWHLVSEEKQLESRNWPTVRSRAV